MAGVQLVFRSQDQAIDSSGRVIYMAEAYASDGRRFTVLADDRLTAFLELEAVVRGRGEAKPLRSDVGVERARA